MTFSDLGLNKDILSAIEKTGYTKPTPIQEQAIPAVLEQKDLMAAAQTGTGKTAAFTLPILHLLAQGKPASNNNARCLILTPTRELAAQIQENIETYKQFLRLKSTVVFGGVKINPQMQRLRGGVDILVATPGRLLDLYNQNAVRFDQLEMLVLDEADRMLDMGFIHDIKRILKALPKKRQNLLFSATFSDDIRDLAKSLVNNPVEISVTPRNTTVKSVKQWLVPVDKKRKSPLLIKLIHDNQWPQVLVFSRTKHGANRLVTQLEKADIKAMAIHGNKSQGARTKALAAFQDMKIQVLVATDIAARGIDISQLSHVVNFDLPNVPEDYVHRIGRTGRAGATGEAVSLVSADEIDQLRDIERLIQSLVTREYVGGFEPQHELPDSKLLPPKKVKPKKPKKNQPRGGGNGGGNRSNNNNGNKNNRRSNQKSGNSSNSKPRRSSSNSNSNSSPGNKSGNNSGNSSKPKRSGGGESPWSKSRPAKNNRSRNND